VTLEVIAAVLMEDTETQQALDGLDVVMTFRTADSTSVQGWNQAYKVARGRGADWFVLGADDIVWHDGWLEAAIEFTDFDVIGLNDLQTNIDDYAPHYMASYWFCEGVNDGWMIPPVYKTWWFDREICERAKAIGQYAPAWNAVLEHRHPDWKTAPMDDTYREAWPHHDKDKAVYLARQEKSYESKST